MTKSKSTDIHVRSTGSLVLLDPRTRRGIDWIEENIGADNGFQPWYPTVLCEARYVDDIIAGLQADGLTLA